MRIWAASRAVARAGPSGEGVLASHLLTYSCPLVRTPTSDSISWSEGFVKVSEIDDILERYVETWSRSYGITCGRQNKSHFPSHSRSASNWRRAALFHDLLGNFALVRWSVAAIRRSEGGNVRTERRQPCWKDETRSARARLGLGHASPLLCAYRNVHGCGLLARKMRAGRRCAPSKGLSSVACICRQSRC